VELVVEALVEKVLFQLLQVQLILVVAVEVLQVHLQEQKLVVQV
jgi:hypothetical protein